MKHDDEPPHTTQIVFRLATLALAAIAGAAVYGTYLALTAPTWSTVLPFILLIITLGIGMLISRVRTTQGMRRQETALAALRASEARYRTLVDSLEVTLSRWLPDTTLIDTNEHYRRVFKIDPEAPARQWITLLPAEDRAAALAPFAEVIAHPRTLIYERPVTLEGGSVRHFQWVDTPILDAAGRVVQFHSMGIDLTERKRAEELIAAQRDLARISSTVTTSEEAWPQCLAIALRLTGLDCGGIYLFDQASATLTLVYHQGLSASFAHTVTSYAPDTANARLVGAGAPSYRSAAEVSLVEHLRREGLRAMAIIPIRYQGQVYGSLNLASRTLYEVPAHVRTAIETVSAEIGNLVLYLRTAQALRESEQQARALVASLNAEQIRFTRVAATVPGAICTFRLSPTGVLSIPYASKAFTEVFGLSLAAVTESIAPLLEHVHPDQVAFLETAVVESARTLQPWRNEYLYQHPTRGEIWIEGYSMPVREEDGSTVWHGFSTDVTERKRAEEQLRLSEVRFRALIEQAPGAITLVNAAGRLTFISASTERVMGYRAEEMLGQDPASLTHPDDLPALLDLLFELMQTPGMVRTTHYRFRHHDGSWRWVESTISNLLHEPSIGALALNFQDITERKQAELALRASEEQSRALSQELHELNRTLEARVRQRTAELAQAARAKDEFLANMSHELRTPLNAILAFSESLLEGVRGPLNPRQQDALRHVEASGKHLLTLINDILDLAKVEAGHLDIQPEPVAVAEVCQHSLLFVRELALKKALSLTLRMQDMGLSLEADPRRLKQMLVNLLSNAVKFTPDGGAVRLEVSADAEAGMMHFAVEDTGIGIAPDDLARLFQPFSQLDSSLSRQHEGTGLGLALVQRLAELHGGGVTVTSEPGKGSRFTIALPCSPPQPQGSAGAAHAPAARPPEAGPGASPDDPAGHASTGRLVLLAEDNEDSVQVIGDYLRARGYAVILARNGREAVSQAEVGHPDLILMDIQMPELDGLEVIRRLRARSASAATPIIALTALAMAGDRERCLQAGASAYLTKPVSLRGLVEQMQHLLDG